MIVVGVFVFYFSMMHFCLLCACPPFGSASSLLEHVTLCHVSQRTPCPGDYDTKSLNDEQWDFMIKVEIMLRNNLPGLKNINVLLTDYFPDRSCVAIRSLRKLAIYKTKYKLINDDANSSTFSLHRDSVDLPELIPFNDSVIESKSFDITVSPPEISLSIDNNIEGCSTGDAAELNDGADDSPTTFICCYCSRAFNSKMGLTQHKRLKNFNDYGKEVGQFVTKSRNTAWDDEKKYIIARLEKDILENSDAPIRNINQQLNSRFPHRSVNQISCLRKRERYKAIFRDIAREFSTSDESFSLDNSNFIHSLLDHDYDFSVLSSNPNRSSDAMADSSNVHNSALINLSSTSPSIVHSSNRAAFNNFVSGDMGDISGSDSFMDVINNISDHFMTLPKPFYNTVYMNFNSVIDNIFNTYKNDFNSIHFKIDFLFLSLTCSALISPFRILIFKILILLSLLLLLRIMLVMMCVIICLVGSVN